MLRLNRNQQEDKLPRKEDVNPKSPAGFDGAVASLAVGSRAHPVAPSPASKKALTGSESLADEIRQGILSGFVGNGAEFAGELVFKEMLRVDGHVSGHIGSPHGTLVISAAGNVEADVTVAVVLVNGQLKGNISASERIQISGIAKVVGNIQTAALIIEQGAIFEGSCHMLRPDRGDQDQVEKQPGGEMVRVSAAHALEKKYEEL